MPWFAASGASRICGVNQNPRAVPPGFITGQCSVTSWTAYCSQPGFGGQPTEPSERRGVVRSVAQGWYSPGPGPGISALPRSLLREHDRLLVPIIALTVAFLLTNALQWSKI